MLEKYRAIQLTPQSPFSQPMLSIDWILKLLPKLTFCCGSTFGSSVVLNSFFVVYVVCQLALREPTATGRRYLMSTSKPSTSMYPAFRLAKVRLLTRSEEHTSELQSRENLVCRLLLEKKTTTTTPAITST